MNILSLYSGDSVELLTRTIGLEVLRDQDIKSRFWNSSMNINQRCIFIDIEKADIWIGALRSSSSSAPWWNEWDDSALKQIQKLIKNSIDYLFY